MIREDSKFRIFQAVMENFLCETIPDTFRDWSEEQQKDYITDNYWYVYEDWDYNFFIEHVDNVVSSVRRANYDNLCRSQT